MVLLKITTRSFSKNICDIKEQPSHNIQLSVALQDVALRKVSKRGGGANGMSLLSLKLESPVNITLNICIKLGYIKQAIYN